MFLKSAFSFQSVSGMFVINEVIALIKPQFSIVIASRGV